ncbi:unnamed protein product, partial [Ectocarpus sp. 13 AM-2016]
RLRLPIGVGGVHVHREGLAAGRGRLTCGVCRGPGYCRSARVVLVDASLACPRLAGLLVNSCPGRDRRFQLKKRSIDKKYAVLLFRFNPHLFAVSQGSLLLMERCAMVLIGTVRVTTYATGKDELRQEDTWIQIHESLPHTPRRLGTALYNKRITS